MRHALEEGFENWPMATGHYVNQETKAVTGIRIHCDELAFPPPTRSERAFFLLVAFAITLFALLLIIVPILEILRHWREGTFSGSVAITSFFPVAGLLFCYLAFSYRKWILPNQFVIDRKRMICGRRWNDHWIGTKEISEVKVISISPGYASAGWPWVMLFHTEGEQNPRLAFHSRVRYPTEKEAFERAKAAGSEVSDFLDIPLEFEDWSESIIQGAQDAHE